jgi:hypothetical protein
MAVPRATVEPPDPGTAYLDLARRALCLAASFSSPAWPTSLLTFYSCPECRLMDSADHRLVEAVVLTPPPGMLMHSVDQGEG